MARDFPEMPHRTRNGRHFPRPMQPREARRCLACPCGKAIEQMRKPESMTLPGIAATAGMFAIGGVSSGWTRLDLRPQASIHRAGHRPESVPHRIQYPVSGDRRPAQPGGLADSLQQGSSPQCRERAVRCRFAWRGAAGRERGRHDRASVAAGGAPSIGLAWGWIALESSACRRMR